MLATAGRRPQSGTVMWDERLGGDVLDCRRCKVRVRTARDSSRKELVWTEEIRTGRMEGRKMSGSVSGEGRYAAIMRSVVERSLVDWFRLRLVVYTS